MCSQAELQNVLSQTSNHMKALFGDRFHSAILYGSYARGTHTADSDIDIMVLVDMDRYELPRFRKSVNEFVNKIDREYNFDFILSILLQDVDTFNKYRNASAFFRDVSLEGVAVNA